MSPVDVGKIGAYIREQREQARISLRQLAQAAGVSNPYLSQIERGLRRPSADILQQIAKGLRISAEALYVQAGFLEDRLPGSAVRDAVLTDGGLNERQKQVLLEIYDSFRKESDTAVAPASLPAEDDDAARPPGLPPGAQTQPAILAGPWADADAGPDDEVGEVQVGEAGPADEQQEDADAAPADPGVGGYRQTRPMRRFPTAPGSG